YTRAPTVLAACRRDLVHLGAGVLCNRSCAVKPSQRFTFGVACYFRPRPCHPPTDGKYLYLYSALSIDAAFRLRFHLGYNISDLQTFTSSSRYIGRPADAGYCVSHAKRPHLTCRVRQSRNVCFTWDQSRQDAWYRVCHIKLVRCTRRRFIFPAPWSQPFYGVLTTHSWVRRDLTGKTRGSTSSNHYCRRHSALPSIPSQDIERSRGRQHFLRHHPYGGSTAVEQSRQKNFIII